MTSVVSTVTGNSCRPQNSLSTISLAILLLFVLYVCNLYPPVFLCSFFVIFLSLSVPPQLKYIIDLRFFTGLSTSFYVPYVKYEGFILFLVSGAS